MWHFFPSLGIATIFFKKEISLYLPIIIIPFFAFLYLTLLEQREG